MLSVSAAFWRRAGHQAGVHRIRWNGAPGQYGVTLTCLNVQIFPYDFLCCLLKSCSLIVRVLVGLYNNQAHTSQRYASICVVIRLFRYIMLIITIDVPCIDLRASVGIAACPHDSSGAIAAPADAADDKEWFPAAAVRSRSSVSRPKLSPDIAPLFTRAVYESVQELNVRPHT